MCPLLLQQIRTPHSLTFQILTSCRTKFVCSGRADYPPRSKFTRHQVGAYGKSLDRSAPGISSHSEQELPRPSESCYVPRNGVIYMVSRNPNTRSGSIVSTLVQNNPKDEREDVEVHRPYPPGTSASLWGERHSKIEFVVPKPGHVRGLQWVPVKDNTTSIFRRIVEIVTNTSYFDRRFFSVGFEIVVVWSLFLMMISQMGSFARPMCSLPVISIPFYNEEPRPVLEVNMIASVHRTGTWARSSAR